jgi:hypothetical protein
MSVFDRGQRKYVDRLMVHTWESKVLPRTGESFDTVNSSEKPQWVMIGFVSVATVGVFLGTLHLRRLT